MCFSPCLRVASGKEGGNELIHNLPMQFFIFHGAKIEGLEFSFVRCPGQPH